MASPAHKNHEDSNMDHVLGVILGGGRGTRLYPLTKFRSKPAVPLAGKYRLIDIPISNCINSDIRRVYILTQFNSVSLHRHVTQTFHFEAFARGFVDILAAQQTLSGELWYQGTADAVRQNLRYFQNGRTSHILILSGDQLYQMDFRKIFEHHRETGSEMTIAALPASASSAPTPTAASRSSSRNPRTRRSSTSSPSRPPPSGAWASPPRARRTWPRWASTSSTSTCS